MRKTIALLGLVGLLGSGCSMPGTERESTEKEGKGKYSIRVEMEKNRNGIQQRYSLFLPW
ncbi:MAG TPA: hypothetical protein VJA18_03400 [Candidatus Nanoarchaeia archaeon]|nr:hypothetical protein [Candidatus Nanoarchaeia archaeon]